MADAKQVQIRRDTANNLANVTPVLAELAYDQTNKTLRVGDGLTQGGTYIPNADDVQTDSVNMGSVTGTANNIIVTLFPAPLSYTEGLRIKFKATAANTGAMTVQVNALAAVPLRMISNNEFIELPENTVINNGIYEANFDGTQFQLLNVAGGDSGFVAESVEGGTSTIFNVDFSKYLSYKLITSAYGGVSITIQAAGANNSWSTIYQRGGASGGNNNVNLDITFPVNLRGLFAIGYNITGSSVSPGGPIPIIQSFIMSVDITQIRVTATGGNSGIVTLFPTSSRA